MMQAIRYEDHTLYLLDQTKLPHRVETYVCTTVDQVAHAIRSMVVRGAPAIGATAAYGMAIAAHQVRNTSALDAMRQDLDRAKDLLASTRPTAVNLFWALQRIEAVVGQPWQTKEELAQAIEREAELIAAQDVAINRSLAENGAELIPDGAGLLTHCNTGALATVGYGTALGVIRAAHGAGKRIHVYAGETRPFCQGARLTTYELLTEQIPVTLITDSMAGFIMQQGKVHAVIVGADRVTRNGDVANKIGTYSLSILAKEHGIPFYVAVPLSTIDMTLATGAEIVIEERAAEEITHVHGQRMAPEGVSVYNPAFDVTPNRYVTALITEEGVVRPPFESNLAKIKGIGHHATVSEVEALPRNSKLDKDS